MTQNQVDKLKCLLCSDTEALKYIPATLTLAYVEDQEVLAYLCTSCFIDSSANEDDNYAICQLCHDVVDNLVDYQDQDMCLNCAENYKENDEDLEDRRQDYNFNIRGK